MGTRSCATVRRWATALLLAGMGVVGSAHVDRAAATPITFAFTGEVDFVSPTLASQFAVGDTISASYTFESTAPSSSSGLDNAIYNTAITAYQATTSGGYSASATAGQIVIVNDNVLGEDRYFSGMFSDAFGVPGFGLAGADVNGFPLLQFALLLVDTTGTAFDDLGLPTTLDLAQFDLSYPFGGMQFLFGEDPFATNPLDYEYVNATIVSFSVDGATSVPEPAPVTILIVGIAWLVLMRRKRAA